MDDTDVELVAIGAGPSNLALAVALEELAPALADRTLVLEQRHDVAWQQGMLLPWARTQVSFLKDLVTLRNPRSKFTFLNYLHVVGRLDEFVNLATFTPYRIEISDYLNWVATSLRRVRIDYGRRCTRIEPSRSIDGGVTGWRVHVAGGSTISCRHLAIGSGREPHIPAVFATLPGDRVVHSTGYHTRAAELDRAAPRRVVVVGGAQSAVELLWSSYQRLPNAQCTLLMRSAALQGYEHSKFANEIYFPSFVPEFFAAPPAVQRRLLDQVRRTNYGAADPELLDTLYRQIYLDRLTGTDRLRVQTMVEVVEARFDGAEVVLTVLDQKTGRTQELRCDVVLLGTGFASGVPELVRTLAGAVGLRELTVNRAYRLALPAPEATSAKCYLQGVNESTHGISDSLLSVVAVRAGEIVNDLLGQLAKWDRRADASWQEVTST